MKNSHTRNFIDKIKDDLGKPNFPVDGFTFSLDDNSKRFNPYTQSSADRAGFPFQEGMPRVNSFFYVTDDYQAYIFTLKESGEEHPENIKKLPWIKFENDDTLPII